MPVPMVSAPARPVRRAFAPLAASVLAVTLCAGAFAQQPPPAAQPKAAPQQPKAPAPAAPKAAPKQQPAPQAAQPPAQPQQQVEIAIVNLPWAKVCGQNEQPGSPRTCVTMMESYLEIGQFLARAMLIEPDGEALKKFRITLPLGMMIPQGTRLLVDQDQPLVSRYVTCIPAGCLADYDLDAAFVGKLKKAQNLVLQGINAQGQLSSFALPLADFAKVNEGPGTEPKQFEANLKKQQEDLQKRFEAARDRFQRQNGGQAPSR